jgi:hypothetical protein
MPNPIPNKDGPKNLVESVIRGIRLSGDLALVNDYKLHNSIAISVQDFISQKFTKAFMNAGSDIENEIALRNLWNDIVLDQKLQRAK